MSSQQERPDEVRRATPMRPTFEIELGMTIHRGRILMNGEELRGVRGIRLDAAVDKATEVHVIFIPENVVIRAGDVEVSHEHFHQAEIDQPMTQAELATRVAEIGVDLSGRSLEFITGFVAGSRHAETSQAQVAEPPE